MRFQEARTNQQSSKTNRERGESRRQSKESEPAALLCLFCDAQLEVRVIQRFPNGDPLCWVKGQQFAYEVQEMFVDEVRGRDYFLLQTCENVGMGGTDGHLQTMDDTRGHLSCFVYWPWALANPAAVLP